MDSYWRYFVSFFLPSISKSHTVLESSLKDILNYKEVQVGKDQEKAQSEKDSHSKNRGGKNQTNQALIP